MLEIRGITVQFGGVTPLNDVTLSFPPGVNGLVGPNGAGKSTLLNVLSGFVTPAHGSVRAAGRDLLRLAPHRRARWGLRRTFQQEQVIHRLTAYDNIRLAAENLGATRSEVDRAVGFIELADPHRPATELTMMERRLVEIAKAVIGRPRVVLLDEPGAGTSETESVALGPIITRLAEDTEVVVVLVDHDMELVKTVCRNIAVLDFGQVIAHGPTGQVLADPAVKRAYLGTEDAA